MGGVGSSRAWMGIPLRHVSLSLLTCQNTALLLILHYSRIMPPVQGQRYFPSTAVLLSELLKLTISLTLSTYDFASAKPNMPATTLFFNLGHNVFSKDSWKLAIPAMLYTLQNSLQYIAVSNLDASTYQIASQLRILSAAAFSVALLRHKLSSRKWLSILLLMIGVALVSIPRGGLPMSLGELRGEPSSGYAWPHTLEELKTLGSRTARLVKRSASYQGIEEDEALLHPRLLPVVGLVATVISAICSGLAGVYFEKVLKESPSGTGPRAAVSIWVRNAQLSVFSIVPALLIGVLYIDGGNISRHGFLAGYNKVVWLVIAMQAFGGILVSLVINFANNVTKNFATSFSIVLSLFFSVYFFDLLLTFFYIVGTSLVIAATWLYNNEQKIRPPSIVINTAVTEEPTEKGFYKDIESMHRARSRDRFGEGLSSSRPTTPSGMRTPTGRRSPRFENRFRM